MRAFVLVLSLCHVEMSKVVNVGADTFFKDVAGDDVVWLIHFTSTKCENHPPGDSPCQIFAPDWEALVGSLKRVKIARVDIDTTQGKSLAQKLGEKASQCDNRFIHNRSLLFATFCTWNPTIRSNERRHTKSEAPENKGTPS
jgi:hypothetical protein